MSNINSEILLEIKNFSAGFGKNNILENINLEIHRKDIVAVLGANGSGKSTLLRSIFGLIKKVKGEINFDGKSITNYTTEELSKIGITYLPQNKNVFNSLSVKDNLNLNLKNSRELEIIFNIFPRLKENYNRKAGLLSGGEKQQLAISMATLNKPKLILLDEPTTGLANNIIENVINFILELNNTLGTSFLIAEQNINSAILMTHKMIILKKGKMNILEITRHAEIIDKIEEVFYKEI